MTGPVPRLGGRARWVRVSGGELAVETVGQGPGLILLHGWTLDRRMWAAQVEALARQFALVLIDRRGFGQSTAPYAPDLEEEDVLRVADALGHATFGLIGMSQAGGAAIACAQATGDRVAGLVLQGISLADVPDAGPSGERIPIEQYVEQVRTGHVEAMKLAWRRHPLMAGLSGQSLAVCDAMLADYDARDLHAAAPVPVARLSDVARLTMPVLAITGAQDTQWRREVTRAVGMRSPHGCAILIEGAGHMCNLTHADAYNAAVASFMQDALAPIPSMPLAISA